LKDGNKSLLVEHNALWDQVTDLKAKVVKAKASVATLEVKVVFIEAHVMDEAAAGEKHFVDFKMELIMDLADLCVTCEHNIQSIGGLYSPIFEGEPSITDYIRWLSAELACLPKVFAGVNDNFISLAIEGLLMMAGDFIDLVALQASATNSGVDVLPGGGEMSRKSPTLSHESGGVPSATSQHLLPFN
jgi:hypothetical protein